MAVKKPPAKKPAKKSAAKKPAAKKKSAANKPEVKNNVTLPELPAVTHSNLDLLELPEEDKAILEKIKLVVDGKINALVEDALGIFNIIIPKTYEYSIDGELMIDARTGTPKQDWNRVTIGDIKTVILKIPIVQLSISSIEVDAWAEAELAKTLENEIKEKAYENQATGTETAKKNKAALEAMQETWRKFFLVYAHKRIQTINDSLTRICDKWSRAIELVKEESKINQFVK